MIHLYSEIVSAHKEQDIIDTCCNPTEWRRKWQPTPVFLPEKSHGQRSLMGYSPWGHKRVGHGLAAKQLYLNPENVNVKWKKPSTKGHVYLWFHLYKTTRIVKSISTESGFVTVRDWNRVGDREWLQMGLGWWKDSGLSDNYCTTLNILKSMKLYN